MPVKWTPGTRVAPPTLEQDPGRRAGRDPVGPDRRAGPHRRAVPAPRRRHPGSGCCTGRPGSRASWSRSTATRSSLRGHTGLEKRYRNLPGTFAVDGTADPSGAADARRADASRRARRRRRAHRVGQPRRGRRPGPGGPGAAGSWSRVCTTPSSSSGSGATTCASRASWSSGSTAPTTSPTRSARSRPRPGRRLGVLARPPRRRAARRRAWPTRSPPARARHRARPTSTCGRRCGRRPSASSAWPVVPKGQDWKTGVCAALGVDDPRAIWRRILGSVHDWKHLEQPLRRRRRAAHRLRHRVGRSPSPNREVTRR